MITNHCAALPVATNILPTWDVRQLPPGPAGTGESVTIVLDNGYRVEISEGCSQIRIVNSHTDESTTIWGDQHAGRPGGSAGHGSGVACFVLADNTRITISAASAAGNTEARASSLVMTRGEASMIIDGMAAADMGALRVHQGRQGHALERLLSDGRANFFENANGIGWQADRCTDGRVLLPAPVPIAHDQGYPKAPTLCQQLSALYHGCEPPRVPARPIEPPACPPSAHAGKHGYGFHHGKHGNALHAGKHGCGVHHGKHGYTVHHGKHGYPVQHGKHGYTVHHGKHGYPAHHGKHGGGVHHGKHGRALHQGKHRGRC